MCWFQYPFPKKLWSHLSRTIQEQYVDLKNSLQRNAVKRWLPKPGEPEKKLGHACMLADACVECLPANDVWKASEFVVQTCSHLHHICIYLSLCTYLSLFYMWKYKTCSCMKMSCTYTFWCQKTAVSSVCELLAFFLTGISAACLTLDSFPRNLRYFSLQPAICRQGGTSEEKGECSWRSLGSS